MDFHAAMETFAEAWVAANTQTAATDPQTVRQKSTEDLPTMLPKEKILDSEPLEISPPETSIQPCKTPPIASPTLSQSPSPSTPVKDLSSQVKSIPIHCVVEQVPSAIDFGSDSKAIESQPHIELDSYAILPQSTPLFDIVGAALIKLGYSTQESFGAKGAIQIKNWKPLPFDVITDSPRASVEDILGELANIVTLRIRLCSYRQGDTDWTDQSVRAAVQELLKEMNQSELAKLSPLSQTMISNIMNSKYPAKMTDDKCREFGIWYKDYKMQPKDTVLSKDGIPKNARLTFHPELELPRLRQWYSENKNPIDEMLKLYASELNKGYIRQQRPEITVEKLKIWWKNEKQREKKASGNTQQGVKRQRSCQADTFPKNSSFTECVPSETMLTVTSENQITFNDDANIYEETIEEHNDPCMSSTLSPASVTKYFTLK